MSRAPWLLATRSAGKIRELVPLLEEFGLTVSSLSEFGLPEEAHEDALEVFDTFEANALAKARWFHARSGGLPTLADDSGLTVDALDGAPGVRSKRWGGFSTLSGRALDDANNGHLLQALRTAEAGGQSSRVASYVCAAACVWSGGEMVALGRTPGRIVQVADGVGGFGYDPYFLSDELGVTFASVSDAAKSAVSHRGRAFRSLLAALRSDSANETKLIGPVDPAHEAG